MARKSLSYGLFGAVLLALLIAMVVITHNALTAPYPGMNDFLSRWEGARSFWIDGVSPYSDTATLNIQTQIYGRPAEADEDFGLFAYPMYTVFYVAPLVGMSYAWASAVWMVVLAVCLVVGLLLLLDMLRWRPHVLMMTALVSFSVFNYYSFRGLILGQPSHIVYLFTVMTLWALTKKHDRLAGVALALTTMKPQMGFLLVPFLLFWGLRMRRWSFVGAFALMWGALMAASFALQPDWFGAWIEQVLLYPSYTRDGSPVWILFEFYGGLPVWVGYGVAVVVFGGMAWGWWSVLVHQQHERLWWVIALTLAATHTAGPRTATPHFMVFMLVLLIIMQQWARMRRGWLNGLVLLGLLVIPWLHFIQTIIPPNLENLSVFLPPIVLVWVALLTTYRLWWSLPMTLYREEEWA